MSFSERMGMIPKKTMQYESMDNETRTLLWNAYQDVIPKDGTERYIAEAIWKYYLKNPIDSEQINNSLKLLDRKWLKNLFTGMPWNRVFDLVEFIYSYLKLFKQHPLLQTNYLNFVNFILKSEYSGYRLINGQITQITSEEEIMSINESLINKSEPVREHLKSAIALLSDRKNPDYRNSIKESISAVEHICRKITGENTLGKALDKLEKKGIKLDNLFVTGLDKLYAYTNGKDGIRHAIMEDPTVTMAGAKFMLVICSAFCNYLTELSADIKMAD